tara:strand:+ start:1516 stop:1989 length:474 start_codon:yes stop_codon:yes gene_type:complete
MDDDAPPSYDSLFGPTAASVAAQQRRSQRVLSATGGALLRASLTASDTATEARTPKETKRIVKKLDGRHIISDRPMLAEGDVVALYDIDRNLFVVVEEERIGGASVKLRKQGKRLSNGCLFTVRRINRSNRALRSSYAGAENQVIALESSLNGKFIR